MPATPRDGTPVLHDFVEVERWVIARILQARRALFPLVRKLAEGIGPVRTPLTKNGFLAEQFDLLRDLAVAEHDDGKALLIALSPLFGDARAKDIWLDLRRSGPNLMTNSVGRGLSRTSSRPVRRRPS